MTSARALVVLLAVAFSVECSNPEKEKVEHVRKGDQYVADKKDEFAVIEYASAIKIDPKYGDAHWKLAQTYERMGNMRAALPAYLRSADASPNRRDAQIKATELLLLARRFEDAKARATTLVQRDPSDTEARLLQANATAATGDTEGAVKLIDAVLHNEPRNSGALVSLGSVYQQAGDLREAEGAFRRAVAIDATSGVRLGLARFLLAVQRRSEAEAVIDEILAKDPRHLLANRMLAGLYMSTNRTKEAELPLKAIVEATQESEPRFQLAAYYARTGRIQEATDLLTALSKNQSTYAEAEGRLAQLDYEEKRTDAAHKRLETLLARAPNYPPALATRARWLLAESKLDAALESAKAAVVADPQSDDAQMTLAAVHETRGEMPLAIASYKEAIRLNPGVAGAQAALARLNLALGKNADALRFAEEAKRAEPGSLAARVVLVRALLEEGELARAETEVGELLKAAPDAAVVYSLQGSVYANRRNSIAARRSFERALELSPSLTEAIVGLSALDAHSSVQDGAVARLEAAIAKQPSNPALLLAAATAYELAMDDARAEDRLRRAVTIDPRLTSGYVRLAQLYTRQKKLSEARAEFQGIAERDPSAVGARTMIGVLFEVEGKRDDAKKVYEGIVGGTVDAPVAANNLAYIYAEQNSNLDMALQLATSAKPKLFDNPSVDDTIGWVYYKKDLASLGVASLESAFAKLPDNPEVMTHLGLTYAKLGSRAKARELLTRARALNSRTSSAEVERVLASLQ